MGRRRQHSGDLALASDQIPGLAQYNIYSGLVTFRTGFARPLAHRSVHATPGRQEKASLRPNRLAGEPTLIGWRRGKRSVGEERNGMKAIEPHRRCSSND